MDIGLLRVGVNVDIQRTDGRIHSAVVSGLDLEMRSLTVEWYEKGETKGKELELDAIFQLNPELMPVENNAVVYQEDENEEDMSVDSEDEEDGEGEVEDQVDLPQQQKQAVNYGGSQDDYHQRQLVNPRQCVSTVDSNKRAPAKDVAKLAARRPTTSSISIPSARRQTTAKGERSNGVSQSQHANNPSAVDSSAQPNEGAQRATALSVAQQQAAAAAVKKKPSCVKEVEKIKLRREERRAAQQLLREQQDQVYDTSLPNWEFDAMIRAFRATVEYCPLSTTDPIVDHQICVCVRKRPLNTKELTSKEIDVVTIPGKDLILVHEPKTKVDLTRYLENQNFRYDYAFDEEVSNEIVYRYTARPLVECIFEKGMATCFAYGQTGSGKTHTMGGDFSSKGQQDCSKGIYALAARDVFRLLNAKYKKLDLVVSASFFEIYSGKVFDLLNHKQKLRVLEDAKQQVQIIGLKEEEIRVVEDVFRLIQHGNNVRTSGVTSANTHSSRSHAIFQIILKKRGTKKLHGKFSLIDLAGNERGADTSSSDRQTRMEGAEINKSLLALKECIRALGRRGAHLPFRVSKLTQVLRDSFIGENTRTCMIAMISPGLSSCEHTLNTLRYADRVKELGPGAAVEGKQLELFDDLSERDIPATPQNSDLAMLRSANVAEVSEELLTFHEAVYHMQEQEEELIDMHHNLIEQSKKWMDDDRKLSKMTDDVDYDVEAYAGQLEMLLATKLEEIGRLKDVVSNFRQELHEEEVLSKKIVVNKRTGNK